MTDIFTPEKRSKIMSHIHGGDTKPEIFVRKLLFSAGFRYRLHDKKLPGKPDIVLKKYKTVIFVNGCFWHCHEGCPDATRPKSNSEFWNKKLKRNKERDLENYTSLQRMGWRVFVVWECACRARYGSHVLTGFKNFLHNEQDFTQVGAFDTEIS